MRIRRETTTISEGDMTPMIDMAFQLIAFFMVMLNFTEADQDERIRLPMSELAKPADGPLEAPIFLQLTRDGNVGIGAETVPVSQLQPYLIREADALRLTERTPSDATMIIRADQETPTGLVQQLIRECQRVGFDRFALRAKEDVGP